MEMQRGATISTCQMFRYSLTRVWDEDAPRCMFVGLNPSTADHRQDDPTIRRCIRFATDFGYGGLEMLNIYAYRTSKPDKMLLAKDPVGPLNIMAILSAAKRCSVCITAWGCLKPALRQPLDFERRALGTLSMITDSGFHPQVYCLGMTKEGFPRHPLFLPMDTQLDVYTNPPLEKYRAAIEKRRRNKAS